MEFNPLVFEKRDTLSFKRKLCFKYKGLVAQWTRAHGYEPWGRGFESLLAQKEKEEREKNIFFLKKKTKLLFERKTDSKKLREFIS